MKTGRRTDPDGPRRVPREREAALGRVRKRPSMLLEFQGKHYNHREPSRERFHPRYDQHDIGSGAKGAKRDRFGPPFFKSEVLDSRPFSSVSSSSYPRTHPPSSISLPGETLPMEVNNTHDGEGGVPTKRPRLLGDMQLDGPSTVDSVMSGRVCLVGSSARDQPSPPHHSFSSPTHGLGLSAYLEDIDSDEEEDGDLLTVDEDEKPPQPSLPQISPLSLSSSSTSTVAGPAPLTKEQLLMRMEAVDREIASTEAQITALQKKQAELEGSTPSSSSSSSSTPSPLHPSPLPSPHQREAPEEEGVSSLTATPGERWGTPKWSILESVYSENKPLYTQLWEAPGYFNIIARHRQFRSELVQLIRRQKRERHEKELQLCERYDAYQEEWKKRLEKVENSSKRKTRDLKNRELFERTFPELKIRREQQERLMRVDQRGFGVVRSELELSQVMCELFEQEEAPARSRRTHALIPAMVVGGPEERLAFHSTNGLIQDPMSLYRASKLTNVWADDEKATFREKYALFPKDFEAISSFLPGKTTSDCVRYYYLSKKNEKFKQVARKATFKRRKFIKPGDLTGLVPHTPSRLSVDSKMRSPLLSEVMMTPRTPPTTATPTVTTPTTPRPDEVAKEDPLTPKPSRYGDWTEEDIANLRGGLRKWGRAWGKIYREVGGRKTATQCKKFFDDFSHDQSLGLSQALSERSSIQNAEKAQRKAASRKPPPPSTPLSRKRGGKTKTQSLAVETQLQTESEGERVGEGRGEGESEAVESASAAETGSAEESGSESTLTDSSPEDGGAASTHSSLPHPWKSHASSASPSHSSQTGSDKGAFDIFISAAEALNNIVPPEVALHDHNYALAPLNSVDLQGTSGLSLIAAAAAVVSPTLSRSAGSGKFPAVSPVRAPRGRPPNTQRRGSGGSTCKLSPTLLSPAGSSIYVPLTDTTKSSFRSRARSAPSDRPRLQLSRAGPSNLRYSISSKSGSPRPILPPASYTRTKDSSGAMSGGAPSLKSIVASRPQHGSSSNAAFETLVNVAVAASPAELPKTTTTQPTATLSISFQNTSSSSAPSTPATSGPALSEGTYSIDMNQAMINILSLAQLTQGPTSSSSSGGKTTQQLLLTPGVGSQPSGLLGTITTQSNHDGSTGKPSNPNTVNVLIGHLTSGATSPSPSTGSESATSSRNSPAGPPPDPRPQQRPPSGKTPKSSAISSSSKPPPSSSSSSSSSTVQTSSDDLSNLNLLSSLVAVVAGSKTTPPQSSHSQHTSTTANTRSSTSTSVFVKTTSTNFSPYTVSSISTPKSSAFKATNLPLPSTASSPAKQKENCTRTKIHEKSSTNLSSLVNSDHSPRSSSLRGPAGNSSPLDNLARSVVRSSSLTHPQSSLTTTNSSSSSSPHSHSPLPTYPSPSPSISQQSTLLLYTRSLSLPNTAAVDHSSEEEDHLESATRGISELSKLLGTDTEPLSSSESTSSYQNSWADQPLPTSSLRTTRTPRGSSPGYPSKAELGNDSSKYLSGLLESHTSHTPHPQKTCSTNTDVTSSHNLSSR